MLDIIIIICCVLAGFALGKLIETKIGEKGKFYQDLTSYVSLLKDNVLGRQLEIASFNQEFAANSSKMFADYILNGKVKPHLSKTQKNNLSAFFDNLDCVSSQALVEHINYHGKVLESDAQNVLQGEVAKASVYSKLGMLIGAMIGILLV